MPQQITLYQSKRIMNLENPPQSGINLWMLSSARKCRNAGYSTHQAEMMIYTFNGQARRPFKANEVRRAVARAYETELAPTSEPKPAKQQWKPAKTMTTKAKHNLKRITEDHLWYASPWIPDDGLTQEIILRELFPDPDGLVCVGKSAFRFKTAKLSEIKGLDQCQFIVPCYMTKVKGLTQDGKESEHCLDNCGERRFCVCDFDEPKSEDHPTIIWYLAKFYHLTMALSSGGKSLHAWFEVAKDDEAGFWKLAIELGADPALMRNRSSFVRMPLGRRDNGALQRVIHFNPDKSKHPLACYNP
jgi:hypothetical protein